MSPSTPMTSLSERPRPKAPYSSSENPATLYVAALKMGQHIEYAGNVTQEGNVQCKAITTCIYGWWRLYG